MAASLARERVRGPVRVNQREMDVEVDAPQPLPESEMFLRGYPQQKVVPSPVPADRPRVAPRSAPPPAQSLDTIGYTQYYPPDDAFAAGPDYLVSSANSSLQIRTRAGDLVSEITLGNFFPQDTTGFLFDPRLSYDPVTGHFILALVGQDSTTNSSTLALAVSATSDPTGSWNRYVIPIGRGGNPATDWGDYPTLGYDGTAIYVCTNMFRFRDNSLTGVRLITVDKQAAISGGTLQPVFVDNPVLPTPPFVANQVAFGLRPVEALSALSNGYLVANGGNFGIALYRISNPLTSPQLTATWLDTTDLNAPGNSPQPGDSGPLAGGDTRLQKSTYRDGVLWTCAGTAPSQGGSGTVTFYRINPAAPVEFTAATIADPQLAFTFPSIAPDASGNAVAVFQGSGAGSLPGIYHALYDGQSGAFSVPALTVQGSSSYAHLTNGVSRWGDYTDAAPDPADGGSVWVQGAIANSTTAWQLHAARIPSSASGSQPPLTPSGFAASALTATSAHLSWQVKGTPDSLLVERKSGTSTSFSPVQTLSSSASAWDDSGLSPSTAYTYRMRAAQGTLFSAYTPPVSITTPAGLTGFTLKQGTVKAGRALAGSVGISAPAPAGGLRVTLTSSSPSVASVPAFVTIPARKTSAPVKVTTRKKTPGTVTLQAALNGVSLSTSLQVAP